MIVVFVVSLVAAAAMAALFESLSSSFLFFLSKEGKAPMSCRSESYAVRSITVASLPLTPDKIELISGAVWLIEDEKVEEKVA